MSDCTTIITHFLFADQLQKGVEGLELVAVSDEREWLVRDFGDKRLKGDWTTDSMALIARDDIDAVIITSYTSAHADQVEAAAARGKHILLDKPISTTLADADRIVAASRKVKIVMAYLLRFLPAYLEAFKAVEEGAIGKLVSGLLFDPRSRGIHQRPSWRRPPWMVRRSDQGRRRRLS